MLESLSKALSLNRTHPCRSLGIKLGLHQALHEVAVEARPTRLLYLGSHLLVHLLLRRARLARVRAAVPLEDARAHLGLEHLKGVLEGQPL